ncbi:hypothetical protein N665_0807s0021 [Sinapis alba]|nr:hypothetical protein N665_0807s0021 [Sinapis alba]
MSINPLMTLLGTTTFLLLVASSQALKPSLIDPCTVSDYPKLCRRTIKGQTNVNAATDMAIKELMKRTMQAKEMAKKEPKGDGGVAVCLSTFGSAFDNLNKALKNIQGNDGFGLNMNLSAALTDFDTCSDAIKGTGGEVSVFYKSAGVLYKMADNCLALSTLVKL